MERLTQLGARYGPIRSLCRERQTVEIPLAPVP